MLIITLNLFDMKLFVKLLFLTICTCLLPFTNCYGKQGDNPAITIESLLDEMISFESAAYFPAQAYTCKQISSCDRRSVSPDKEFWFANDDGAGFVRPDTIAGRVEKVMFEADGPGVITRMWMTTLVKNGTLRFYFDGEKTPRFEIPAYDMNQIPFTVGKALSLIHTNYTLEGKGGNTFMLPLPYQKSCRITFEEPDYNKKIPRYYQVNYRTYGKDAKVKTFDITTVNKLQDKLKKVNETLLNPPTFKEGESNKIEGSPNIGTSLQLDLPKGKNAVRSLDIDVKCNKGDYGQMMRNIILKISFDGKETVWVPLSDFSGAGFGSPKVESWYLSADGKGRVTCRWVMPYKEKASIELVNAYQYPVNIKMEAHTTNWQWTPNTLYFHTSWKQQRDIPLNNKYDVNEGNLDWNFTTITGRGVYRGDLLSLYNYAPDWYGEGDEKIWVDDDTFPSHFGTGTEDYYNCSWAPVVPFHTAFGGAPRADNPSSYGFNAFVRTRNIDDIPFNKKLRFDLEMLSWNKGKADYAATTYWYGDIDTNAEHKPSKEDVLQKEHDEFYSLKNEQEL
jgi:hypothetical protein